MTLRDWRDVLLHLGIVVAVGVGSLIATMAIIKRIWNGEK